MTRTEERYAQKSLLTTSLVKNSLLKRTTSLLYRYWGSKCLQDMPPCIQRFRMRRMRYSYKIIVHVPGRDLATADALSKAPLHRSLTRDEKQLNKYFNLHVSHIMECLPTTQLCLQEILLYQDENEICSKLKQFCSKERLKKHHPNCSLTLY